MAQEQLKTHERYWLLIQCQFWIFNLFVCALSLYLISQISFIDQAATNIYATDNYNYSLQAIELWDRGYIIDVKVVNTDNCPQAYQPLINYTWPGTKVGCYCSAKIQTHTFDYVMNGDCSSQLIDLGCNTIKANDPELLKMWKGGKLICYKRAQALTFYNSILEKAPDGTVFKKCAQGSNFQVNTLPQISCPITSISNKSISGTETTLSLSDNNQYLYFNGQLDYPIADFKLTEYKFCKFFQEINISPQKNGNYQLQIVDITETCNGTDPRMVQFDYLNQQQFIIYNTRIYDLISQLPGYPQPSPTYQYRLGFIRYPAWTYQCRNSSTHSIESARDHLNFKYIGQSTKLLIYVGVPCLILFAILLRAYYIVRHIFQLLAKKQFNMVLMSDQDVVQQIPNLNLIKSSTKQALLTFLQILLIIGTMVVFILSTLLFLTESRWIKQSFLMGCTQDHLQGIFYQYEDFVDKQRFVINRCILFCVVLFVAECVHFTIRVLFGDLKGKQIQQQKPLSAQQLLRQQIFYDKQMKMENQSNLQLQDSSDVLLNIERNDQKVYDLDNMMSNQMRIIGGDQTDYNFYAGQSIEAQQVGAIGKKKKKKKGFKKRNLFKEDS